MVALGNVGAPRVVCSLPQSPSKTGVNALMAGRAGEGGPSALRQLHHSPDPHP